MKNYSIKITGNGTREDIAKALREIADAVFHPTSMGHGKNLSDDSIDGAEWEDATLMTEISLTHDDDDIPEQLFQSPKI